MEKPDIPTNNRQPREQHLRNRRRRAPGTGNEWRKGDDDDGEFVFGSEMEDDLFRPITRWWVDASGMARVWVDPMLEEALGFKRRKTSLQEIGQSTTKEVEELISYNENPASNELPQDSEKTPSNSSQDADKARSKLTIQTKSEASPTARIRLYEICSANNWEHPSFVLCSEEGTCHQKRFAFKVIVQIEGLSSTRLECFGKPMPNHNAAQDHAAEGALWYLSHLGFLS